MKGVLILLYTLPFDIYATFDRGWTQLIIVHCDTDVVVEQSEVALVDQMFERYIRETETSEMGKSGKLPQWTMIG